MRSVIDNGKQAAFLNVLISLRDSPPVLILLEILLFVTIALSIGIIGNIAGIGGGIIIMIVLLFLLRIDPVTASGLSLVTILASAAVGSASNYRQHAINTRLLIAICIPASLGVLLGSYLVVHFKDSYFNLIFSFVSISIGLFSLVVTNVDRRKNRIETGSFIERGSKTDLAPSEKKNAGNVQHLFTFLAGIAGGFLGIGVGGIVGTYLTAVRKINPKIAFSTVLSAMIFTSIIGSSFHLLAIKPIPDLLVLTISLATGAAIGGFLGSYISSRIQFFKLRLAQGYIIVSLGLLTLLLTLVT
ncbi:MAG: sulfite exporter TauE/SafE family protein [Thermoplasmata archaeon]